MKESHLKILKIFTLVALFSIGVVFVIASLPEGTEYTEAYTISEYTEYGLAENTIFINITDNLDKDNYINISHIFNNNQLTDKINYKNLKMLANVNQSIYGQVNTSIGKYHTLFNACINTSVYNNETQLNETYEICNDIYLNGLGDPMNCDHVLGDKSCLIEEVGIVGQELVEKFINIPISKQKINIGSSKIEQKQNGIPIAKGSTIQLKSIYSHPIANAENVPGEIQNKYDIEVCSSDGKYCSVLDPNWWNTSWSYYKEYTNLTGNITYMYFNSSVNDNSDFNDTRFISCYDDALVFNHTLEAKIGTYAQMRVDNLGENCTLRYYGNPTVSSTSSASNVYNRPVSVYYFDANPYDFVGDDNGTVSGATLVSGYINGSYDFNGASDSINSNFVINTAEDLSISTWVNFDTFGSALGVDTNTIYADSSSVSSSYSFSLRAGLSGTNTIILRVHDGSNSLSIQGAGLSTETWYHVVGVYDEGTGVAELYINGVSQGTDTGSGGYRSAFDMVFGKSPRWGRYFDGKIDEPYIYDEVLTPEQVYRQYTQTAPNFIEGNETAQGDDCEFSGFVKDEEENGLNNSNVKIWNQNDISEFYETSSDSSGAWAINITTSTKTFMAGAYFNNTLIGQLKPFISGTC